MLLDVDFEHDNNYLKEVTRKQKRNVTQSSVSCSCKILKFARHKAEGVTRECQVMKRSGKHFVKSSKSDMARLVNAFIEKDALTEHLGQALQEGFKYLLASLKPQ